MGNKSWSRCGNDKPIERAFDARDDPFDSDDCCVRRRRQFEIDAEVVVDFDVAVGITF